MKLRQIFFVIAAFSIFFAEIFHGAAQSSNAVASAPIYVPDYSHAGEPMPDGIFQWDALTKTDEVTNGLDFARFTFSFTNVSTNQVVVLNVHPSCGCTTAELPPTPWIIPASSNETIKVKVNLAGKSGMVFKSVTVTTDKGHKDLLLRINILPAPPAPPMSAAAIAQGIAAAKVDRQAVFKGDCASCHTKNIEGKYGEQLFAAACAICHEAEHRATMVPDLHHLKDATSLEFWRTWIASGKPGSLMPAFAQSQGGPLTDIQIASLAGYLNNVIPPRQPRR